MPAYTEIVGKVVRTGKKEPKQSPTNLQFAKYFASQAVLPTLPKRSHHAAGIATRSFPMYANDRLGDCTCAALGHMVQVWRWRDRLGSLRTPPTSAIENLYWATGDEDDGRYMQEVLDYWRHNVVTNLNPSLTAYVEVNVKNWDHVKAAIYLFGGIYIGLALPEAAQSMIQWNIPQDQKLTGKFEPGSWGGHAINIHAFNPYSLALQGCTWGQRINISKTFWDAYVDEAFAIIHPDWLALDKSPHGFNLQQLKTDLNLL